jgi:hypothetical protein
MEIDLTLCRAWSVSNRQRDFWYRGHSEAELRTFWRRAKAAAGMSGRQDAGHDAHRARWMSSRDA